MKPTTLFLTPGLICLFACTFSLQAQPNYNVFAIAPACLPAANAVVRFSETTYTVEGPGKAVFQQTLAVTILNERGKYRAAMALSENKFIKIKTLQGRLFDASGQLVRATAKSDIEEHSLSDQQEFADVKLKSLFLDYLAYPYTVEFTTAYSTDAFFLAPSFTIQHLGESVEKTTFSIVFPNDYRFKWKFTSLDLKPEKTTRGNMQVWTWKVEQLPAIPQEVFTPFHDDVYAEIQIAPEQIFLDKMPGNFSTWQEVGRFFYELNKNRDRLSPQMQAQVAQLTASLNTPQDKIKALYRYLQEQCRYVSIQVGIGGWQTFDAAFVEQRKYGDCKALTNYMKALLKAAGINSYQALVHAGDDGAPELFSDLPLPQFNHVILYVPEVDYWLECTSRDFPANYLGTFTADRPTLLLTEEGGRLLRTPALADSQNTRTSTLDIALDEDGNAAIRRSALFSGSLHEYYRTTAAQSSQTELEKQLMDNISFSVIKVHQLKVHSAQTSAQATLNYRLDASKYATKAGRRLFVPLTKASPFSYSLPADTNRIHELVMPDAFALNDTFLIHFPPGYSLENLPAGKSIQSEFFSYQLQLEKGDNQVTAIRSLAKKQVRQPAENYETIRKQLADIAKLDASQMVLVKKE